ncbi:MAG: helicase-exonuclease AddAB subunit AddB [Clostridia bacterium]|nr:helicase-exonuclease AddAB subunit AddB [Clostridia bacterium]
MGLRFIYGRAGTGKSEFCFNEIKKNIDKPNKIYMITPEQFSYMQERKMLDILTQNAVINAEVLTFARMAYRVFAEEGVDSKVNLSKTGKAMLVSHILQEQKKNLTFLNRSEENVELVANQIKELKKHMITKEMLNDVISKTENQYMKAKLEDIDILYENYEEKIQNSYIDEDDVLTILSQKLEESDLFNDTIIYIDEFSGFTKQEYEIIRKLLKKVKQVNITVCTDSLKQNEDLNDIFYTNKKTVEKLIQIAKEEKVVIEKETYLEELKRFKNEELVYLEKNMCRKENKKYDQNTNQIQLFLAQNPFSEIEQVAKTIIDLVANYDYRYKDISVITKDTEKYASIISAIFARYNIPVFIDQKKDFSQNILVKYILALVEIFAKNWSYEAMFNYLKTGLSPLTKEEIFLLENYCISYGIKGSKWYKEPWKIAKNDEELETLNQIREKIVTPLLEFKNKLSRTKTVKDLSKAVYEFLDENGIYEKLQQKAKNLRDMKEIELSNIYETTWNTVIGVLDELVMVLQDEKLSFEEYTKLLKIGLLEAGLGTIPASLDQVMIADVERSRTHTVKAAFIIGMNDGVFPSNYKEEGFLNDNDREYLKQNKIELAKNTKEQLYEENFNIYKAFTIPEEKLYISYTSTDNDGKTLRPSVLISKIKRIYPNIEEKSDMIENISSITTKEATFYELLSNIRSFEDGNEIDDIWFELYKIYANDVEYKGKLEEALKGIYYKNEPEKISKENIENLYGNTLKTSISRLEQYKRCAFSFYLKYGLGLNEKSLFEVKSIDTGNFMHDIIDEFFTQVLARDLKLKEMTEEEIYEIVKSIINEKLTQNRNYILGATKKYQVLTKRLEKLILQAMKYIIATITNSDFEIIGNEVEFNKNKQYPPIVVPLEDGKKVEITGKIDRIDLAKGKDGNYIRIIDYKSSVKNIDLNEVVAGLQIQLLTYLDAVTKTKEDLIPAGVLYFNVIDPIIKADQNKTNEEIEQEIKKQFKMQGLILADVNVVRMMDKTLEKGASNVIPAYLDQNQNISEARSSVIKKEEFESLQKHIDKVIKEIAKEIYSGEIGIRPYYNQKKKKTPCDYCEYKSICNFDANCNSYYYIQNKPKEQILEEIRTPSRSSSDSPLK